MATTTNYGWTTPDDTALVKDGASAIRSLGTSADATVKTIADGRGLVHINTTSFSAVASVSLAANTFTSTYSNYKIIFNVTSKVTGTTVFARMRAAGSDNTSTNYNGSLIEKASTGTTIPAYNESNKSTMNLGSIRTGVRTTFEIFDPQKTEYTTLIGSYYNWDGTANGANDQGFYASSLSVTTSYDSMTFYVSSGSITGYYSVYGYK